MLGITDDDSILAIGHTHNIPNARLLARAWLMSGGVSVFLMEWPRAIAPQNLNVSFDGLNPNDAAPTLRDLAVTCLARGIAIAVPSCCPIHEPCRCWGGSGQTQLVPHAENALKLAGHWQVHRYEFQRHKAVDRRVFGFINNAHPAATDTW